MRARFGRRRDERGGIALVTAISVVLLVGVASFAIDIGYQRVARRDMQAVADLVAMDMAREIQGRTTSNILNSGNWVQRVQASLDNAKQQDTVGPTLSAVPCTAAQAQARGATLASNGVCAVPGVLMPDGTFADSGSAPATHVKVLAGTTVDFFLPVYASSGGANRSAVAKAVQSACFAMGSYLASLSTAESPVLNSILGDALNTSVLSYERLATVDLSLLYLSAALGAGSPQELLETEVTAGQLFTAMATAISKKSPQNQADIEAIGVLQAAASASTPAFAVGDLIALGPNATDALGMQVNALDLVKGAASLAHDDPNVEGDESFLDLAQEVSIPGVAVTGLEVGIVQGPQIYCGPVNGPNPPLSTRQVRVLLTAEILNLAVVAAPVKIEFELKLANANGMLTGIEGCPTVSGLTVGVSGQTVADLDVTLRTRVALQLLPLVPTLTLVDIVATPVPLAMPTQSSSVHITPLPAQYGVKYATGSGSVGLASLQQSQVKAYLAGVQLNVLSTLLAPVFTVLSGVVSTVNTAILPELRTQLGLTLAGVHVWATKPERAGCTVPQLAQ